MRSKMVAAAGLAALMALGSAPMAGGSTDASGGMGIVVNGQRLEANAQVENGTTMAPVRAVAEAMGGSVSWDAQSGNVTIRGKIGSDEVGRWIVAQGSKKGKYAYYLDGLTAEEANLDDDPEPEVLAKIEGGSHLGDFFVFDMQADGSYKLIFEKPWLVVKWSFVPYYIEGNIGKPLYEIVTSDGGTDLDIRDAHLMYKDETGQWTEAWSGNVKTISSFQNNLYVQMGNYSMGDEFGVQLMYWQTELKGPLGDPDALREIGTKVHTYKWENGRFVEKTQAAAGPAAPAETS